MTSCRNASAHRFRSVLATVLPLLLLPILPARAASQASLTVAVGASSVHFSTANTGTAAVGAVRLGVSLLPSISLEAGATAGRYRNPAGNTDNLLLPEAGLHIGIPLGPTVGGYIAGGAGASIHRGSRRAQRTVFGAAGVSFHLPSLWTITAEVRARSIHGSGHMVDMTLGFSRHLGL